MAEDKILEDEASLAEDGPDDGGGEVVVVDRPAPTDEWSTAALAHASALLTLILGAPAGLGVPIGLAVPLAIYFGYRSRSRFVAFHALQAFVYQLVGVLIVVGGGAVGGSLLSIAWSIVGVFPLVGILFIPSALLLTVLTGLLVVGLPLAWVGFGLYAAYRVYQGQNYHYHVIGGWVEEEVRA